jgi:hypothetical protein
VKINTNLKRLIREYEFLLEDIDDVVEIHKTANQELNRAIRMAKDDDIAESEFEKDEVEEDEVETFEDTPERKVLKKLFRKIVFKCHPDRLPKEMSESEKAKMQDLYEKAVLAHDRDNWGLMVVVAIKLDIKLPKEAEDMVGRISEETEGLKNQITQLTNSFAWQWYHAQDEIQKKMVSDYLNTLKMIKEKKAISSKEGKKILIVGHPRTGTGYTAKLLQSWGLDVQHERMGKDGISHWGMAVGGDNPVIFSQFIDNMTFNSVEWDTIIYCVRDPKTSIPSIVYTENTNKESFEYRMKRGGFNSKDNPIVDAINSIVSWDKLIQNLEPDFVFRIEHDHKPLFEFLKKEGYKIKWNEDQIGKKYNAREHKSYEELMQEAPYVLERFKQKINSYAKRLGYNSL